jgi:hypothetical protein
MPETRRVLSTIYFHLFPNNSDDFHLRLGKWLARGMALGWQKRRGRMTSDDFRFKRVSRVPLDVVVNLGEATGWRWFTSLWCVGRNWGIGIVWREKSEPKPNQEQPE